MKYKVLIFTIFLIGIFMSCTDEPAGPQFPSSPEEIQESTEISIRIGQEASQIVDDIISNAHIQNQDIDPSDILEKIQDIPEVKNASLSDTETTIIVEKHDGTFQNVLLVNRRDDRIFDVVEGQNKLEGQIEEGKKESDIFDTQNIYTNYPQGSSAVILAPFQWEFDEDLTAIRGLFESAGFTVTKYVDDEANVDRFHGSYLQNYDVIYISTHGATANINNSGSSTDVLYTGEEVSYTRTISFFENNNLFAEIAQGSVGGNTYYALTVQWLENTVSTFSNSWIFANACETTADLTSQGSMSRKVHQLGAGGYSGWDLLVNNTLAIAGGKKIVSELVSGRSLRDATEITQSDWGLRFRMWLLRIILPEERRDYARVENLNYTKQSNESFYLINPDRIVGTAEVIPSSGTPGTDVVYEVTIRSQYAAEVNEIYFDIDNTGERIDMEQVTQTLWRRDDLRVPVADEYPRVDTFTFSALDNNDNIIGSGSATFTILPPQTAKVSGHELNNVYKW